MLLAISATQHPADSNTEHPVFSSRIGVIVVTGRPLSVSYLGFACGLASARAYDANMSLDVVKALDRFAFKDSANLIGKVAFDLGNLYTLPGLEYPNGSLLFFLLQQNDRDLNTLIRNLDQNVVLDKPFGIITETMQQGLATIDESLSQISLSKAPDLIRDEFTQVAKLMRHACQRGLLMNENGTHECSMTLLNDLEDLIPQQRLNWLARNRSGGLRDSIKRFEPLLRQYRDLTGDIPKSPSLAHRAQSQSKNAVLSRECYGL